MINIRTLLRVYVCCGVLTLYSAIVGSNSPCDGRAECAACLARRFTSQQKACLGAWLATEVSQGAATVTSSRSVEIRTAAALCKATDLKMRGAVDSCHLIAHKIGCAVGEAALALLLRVASSTPPRLIDWERLRQASQLALKHCIAQRNLTRNTKMCGSGCEHGVMSTFVAAVYSRPAELGGGMEGLRRELPLYCQGAPLRPRLCYHGIGRALLWPWTSTVTSYSLSSVDNYTGGLLSMADMQALCTASGRGDYDSRNAVACRNGAIMQLVHNKMQALVAETGHRMSAMLDNLVYVSNMIKRLCQTAPMPVADAQRFCATTVGKGAAFAFEHNKSMALYVCNVAFGPDSVATPFKEGFPSLGELRSKCFTGAIEEIQIEKSETFQPEVCQAPIQLLSPIYTIPPPPLPADRVSPTTANSNLEVLSKLSPLSATSQWKSSKSTTFASLIEESLNNGSRAHKQNIIGFDNQSDTEWGQRNDYGITSMEIRMAAAIGLVLISMILGACVYACKITIKDGIGCCAMASHHYDRVLTVTNEDWTSGSSDKDSSDDHEQGKVSSNGNKGIQMI